jgi:hypothetical protein
MITRPINMTLHDWTDQVNVDLESTGLVGKLTNNDWQQWGAQLINNTGMRDVPNPYDFKDWRDWGTRMCEELAI